MKFAIYFSGRINKYEYLIDTLYRWKQTHDIDYFCSLNTPEIDEYHQQFLDKLDIQHYFYQEHNDIYKSYWFDRFRLLKEGMEHPHVWYKISSALYNNMKAFELIEAVNTVKKYDVVMKFRADTELYEVFQFPDHIEENSVYIPAGHDCTYEYPDYGLYAEGINDHFAYGDVDTMRIYSNLYKSIEEYCGNKRPYHPESLLLHHLKRNSVIIKRFALRYWFRHDRHLLTDEFYHPNLN